MNWSYLDDINKSIPSAEYLRNMVYNTWDEVLNVLKVTELVEAQKEHLIIPELTKQRLNQIVNDFIVFIQTEFLRWGSNLDENIKDLLNNSNFSTEEGFLLNNFYKPERVKDWNSFHGCLSIKVDEKVNRIEEGRTSWTISSWKYSDFGDYAHDRSVSAYTADNLFYQNEKNNAIVTSFQAQNPNAMILDIMSDPDHPKEIPWGYPGWWIFINKPDLWKISLAFVWSSTELCSEAFVLWLAHSLELIEDKDLLKFSEIRWDNLFIKKISEHFNPEKEIQTYPE